MSGKSKPSNEGKYADDATKAKSSSGGLTSRNKQKQTEQTTTITDDSNSEQKKHPAEDNIKSKGKPNDELSNQPNDSNEVDKTQVKLSQNVKGKRNAPISPEIWIVPVGLLVIAMGLGAVYLSQNSQQAGKPLPTEMPEDEISRIKQRVPELSIDILNKLDRPSLDSQYKKLEDAVQDLQSLKKKASDDNNNQLLAKVDAQISMYRKQKDEINRAIANLNAASTEDKDKLQKIKNSVLAYDNVAKLQNTGCDQKEQVTSKIDVAIAGLKTFPSTSPLYNEAKQLTEQYATIKRDFPNKCKALTPTPQTIPTSPDPDPTTSRGVDTPPQPNQPEEPIVTSPSQPNPPPAPTQPDESEIVKPLPGNIDVQQSGQITPSKN